MKTEELDKAVSTNAEYWEQASDLLRNKYKMQFYLRGGQKGYQVALENKSEAQRFVVIERNTKVVQPAFIDARVISHHCDTLHTDVYIIATHTIEFR